MALSQGVGNRPTDLRLTPERRVLEVEEALAVEYLAEGRFGLLLNSSVRVSVREVDEPIAQTGNLTTNRLEALQRLEKVL
jgi:hypothetical protein